MISYRLDDLGFYDDGVYIPEDCIDEWCAKHNEKVVVCKIVQRWRNIWYRGEGENVVELTGSTRKLPASVVDCFDCCRYSGLTRAPKLIEIERYKPEVRRK